MSSLISTNLPPQPTVEVLTEISSRDLDDLCDATDAAIEAGGGFGWLDLPAREILERFWQGVVAMPVRQLFVARMDGVICGTCQLVLPSANNQAQAHSAQLTTHFVAPWARGYNLSERLLDLVEQTAIDQGIEVINLDVRETMTSAIKIYETAGYKRTGENPYYAKINGAMVTGFYYTKHLSCMAESESL